MSEVNAWLLDLGEGLHAAVGELEMVHILPEAPALFEIPQTPDHCRRVLVWRGEVLPLMDIAMRLEARSSAVDGTRGLIAVTAFEEAPGRPARHGALWLNRAPARIRVDDAQACGLPESLPDWRPIAISCFDYAGLGPVPVLDLHTVFSTH